MAYHNGKKERLLIVDGYNVLNAWRGVSLNDGAHSLEEARLKLVDSLHDYAGFSGQRVLVVFDAWMSDRKTRTTEQSGQLTVVFTQKGETADHYIERLCDEYAHRIEAGDLELRVATSDNVEQTLVFGRGAARLSARELIIEMEHTRTDGRRNVGKRVQKTNTLMDRLPKDIQERLKKMQRGES